MIEHTNDINLACCLTMIFSLTIINTQYRSGDEAVPGCNGETESKVDFCAVRASDNTVWLKGNDGKPSYNFPLGLCEGDCNADIDCQPGLVW